MLEHSTDREDIFRYNGLSMWPSFQAGDLLLVKKVPPGRLRPGDCIVYRKASDQKQTIHRIVAVHPEMRTRGDAMPFEDDEPVSPAWVIGRVEARIRYGRVSRVCGGRIGVWAGKFFRYAGRLEPSRNSRGGRVARFVQRLCGQFTAPWLRRARVASYASAGGRRQNYLLCGKRVVGVYDERGKNWTLFWPYCLFIDPRLLPPLR